jgi:AhpC/TSA family
MRRNWNGVLWAGFAVALAAAFSYIPFFALFSSTRDFPWANLLLFLAAGCLLGTGLYRAFRQPKTYRGKISGTLLSLLSLILFGLFCFGVFYEARNIPAAAGALRPGQRAPDFTLAGIDGKPVTLSQLRQANRAVLVIFYRGYW